MSVLNVVTIGGGGGHAQVLKALRGVENIRITGICPGTDSGGSTGTLLEDYNAGGYLGDLTKCVAALCPNPTLAEALMYRYGKGSLSGHSVKNMLLLALEETAGHKEGLRLLWELCELSEHRILPVITERAQLCAKLSLGEHVVGETNIDRLAQNPLWHPRVHAIEDIYLKPAVAASSAVLDAVAEAHAIVICPGDFYSSIVPVLLPKGMREALAQSPAPIVLVLNIMNKQGETDNYTAEDFIERVEGMLGRRVTVILANNGKIPQEALARYSLEEKIEFHLTKNDTDSRIQLAPFVVMVEDGSLCHDTKVLRNELIRALGVESTS